MKFSWWSRSGGQAVALLACSIAFAPLTASMACAVPNPVSRAYVAAAPDDQDDLMFSNDGARAFLRHRFPGADRVDRLMLKTDECGLPASLANGKATLRKSALADHADTFDGFEEDDPLVEAQTQMSRWLSAHPEIAVVSDGTDKWCGYGSFEDQDVSPEFIATWRVPGYEASTNELAAIRGLKPAYIA